MSLEELGVKVSGIQYRVDTITQVLNELNELNQVSGQTHPFTLNVSGRVLEINRVLARYGLALEYISFLNDVGGYKIVPIIYPLNNSLQNFLDDLFSILKSAEEYAEHENEQFVNRILVIYKALNQIDLLFVSSIRLLLLNSDVKDKWSGVDKPYISEKTSNLIKGIFSYASYLPYLSRIKREFDKEFSGESNYLFYFLNIVSDWGVVSDVIFLEDNKLIYLTPKPEYMDRYTHNIINIINNRHGVDYFFKSINLDNFVDIFFHILMLVDKKDLSFAMYVLKEARYIYNTLGDENNFFLKKSKMVSGVLARLSNITVGNNHRQ